MVCLSLALENLPLNLQVLETQGAISLQYHAVQEAYCFVSEISSFLITCLWQYSAPSVARINEDGAGEFLACLRQWQKSRLFQWVKISLFIFLVLLRDLI